MKATSITQPKDTMAELITQGLSDSNSKFERGLNRFLAYPRVLDWNIRYF